MNKILCPTDFSKAATKAVEFAAIIAQKSGAPLTVFHALHLPKIGTTDAAFAATEASGEQRRQAIDKLNALCRHLSETHGHQLKVDYLVQENLLGDAVEELTEEGGYTLVVVGSTGGGNTLEEILVGSNTELIIQNVKCPVLSIPVNAVPAEFNKIVYASDYNEEDTEALSYLLGFARLFDASVEIVHVSSTESSSSESKANLFRQDLRTALPEYDLGFHEVVHPDEVVGMKDYLTRKEADLLVILKKRKGFFSNLFTQSFSEQLTYQSKLPILFIHA
ncbi:universal stress protein [Adhaeribacter aquaticus]|uniref:universal stress protein n=1 Tax=Adhaeribacter aquaticus TaxID=299567 RepID=UPI0004071D6A|nr:universal stress protein [Adhaeribacter aquaticus]